ASVVCREGGIRNCSRPPDHLAPQCATLRPVATDPLRPHGAELTCLAIHVTRFGYPPASSVQPVPPSRELRDLEAVALLVFLAAAAGARVFPTHLGGRLRRGARRGRGLLRTPLRVAAPLGVLARACLHLPLQPRGLLRLRPPL